MGFWQRILVVDDNQNAAELLQLLLEYHGFDVHIAINGASIETSDHA